MRTTKKARKCKKKIQMFNKRLIKKYYFLLPRNVWTGKPLKDYDYTWINWGWSDGWDKAFGMMYLKELGDEIKRIGQKDFMILQQKEKYGSCRNYTSGTSLKAHDIIRKYEALSKNICYFCGRPDVHMTDLGWILPVCKKCYEKTWRRGSKYGYEEVICDENPKMADTYNVTKFSKDGDEIIKYDYSDTTNKIRIWWNKNHPDDQVELYKKPEENADGI